MIKVLDPKIHGILDYALAILFLIAPAVFGFTDIAATLSYIIGVVYVGTSLLTQYPLGLFKLIPFPIHGALESGMAVLWIFMPWLFNFSENDAARNFFVAAGVGLLVVVLFTNYKAIPGKTKPPHKNAI